MSRKSISVMVLAVLTSMLFVVLRVQMVEASGTIYIRADGGVEATDKIQRDGDVYTFADNINDSIVVERSNITIDGNGYMLQGSGSANGFSLSCIENVTVKNTNIKGFYIGIYLNFTWHNVISRNNIANNRHSGIRLHFSSNNTISRNNLTHNFYAFSFRSSSQNNVSVNNITNNKDGVFLLSSSGNIISENNVLDNERRGVALLSCWSNTVSGNRIINNTNLGVRLYQSSNNTVLRNNLTHNIYGAWLFLSFNNNFHYNNFIANSQHVYIEPSGSANFWDNDLEGNYWSNYTGVDSDDNGIGDTEHVIDENNQDNYPLMGIFSSFNTSLGYHVNVISNSTVEDFEYFESNSTIKMCVSNVTEDQTFGFCRVCIPHALMDVSNISVTIDDGAVEVLHFNNTIYDNDTHRWIYFAYQHSKLEITIIPEFPSLLILPLFMIATLLAVMVYRLRNH